jgi:hypothetical protein
MRDLDTNFGRRGKAKERSRRIDALSVTIGAAEILDETRLSRRSRATLAYRGLSILSLISPGRARLNSGARPALTCLAVHDQQAVRAANSPAPAIRRAQLEGSGAGVMSDTSKACTAVVWSDSRKRKRYTTVRKPLEAPSKPVATLFRLPVAYKR